MARTIILATILGVLVGVTVGYPPFTQRQNAPTAQLLMQQAGQTRVAASAFRPNPSPRRAPLLIAILAGLIIVVPVFPIARRRAN